MRHDAKLWMILKGRGPYRKTRKIREINIEPPNDSKCIAILNDGEQKIRLRGVKKITFIESTETTDRLTFSKDNFVVLGKK